MAGKTSVYIQDDVLKDLEQDTFGHKHIADAIVDSILTTKPPFIIGIFGGWGTGKSSLVEIIYSSLKKNKVATVTIDAWRYSSAENLRRAFLVHVAKKLAPALLDDLRRGLYTSEQETIPEKPSRLSAPKIPSWDYIQDILKTFFGLVIIFLGFLFIVFAIKTAIQNNGDFLTHFDWIGFLDKFVDLAFVPFLLTLVNYLRLYVLQRPVTVLHERIDADELFSEYFDKVIDHATSGLFSPGRLVIFIDNLDRLTDEKMVEALESIKTYLHNDKCVFVVTCDDNVVRSTINSSMRIKDNATAQAEAKAGEHYLDKFFQQTFRLPEYNGINLHDFAERNFATTQLYIELKSKDIDVRNLISIILPSDVKSPRKVKRLLNEFIALYEIVKRREHEKDGQLEPGLLTGNLEFLGKFSTIRAEYPEFYVALITDANLLARLTDLIQKKEGELDGEFIKWKQVSFGSLIAYLRKTQTIVVNDIESYIWLSQDTLALGLKGNHNNLLRTSLADGNIEQVKSLLGSEDDNNYRILLAQVASRIVEQRLVGIERLNGVKILSDLLPDFPESIRPEISHVAAKLIPLWPVDQFSADGIFNVLRWARWGGIDTQREKLVNQILVSLDNNKFRQSTFDAVLRNADVVEKSNAHALIQEWLAKILSAEFQAGIDDNTPEDPENKDVHLDDQNAENREFAEWLISQAEVHSENALVIDIYFSQTLLGYMIRRLITEYKNVPYTYLDNEGLGKNIKRSLDIISNRITDGVINEHYWKGMLQILSGSAYVPELKYCIEKIEALILFIPQSLIEEILNNIFIGVIKLTSPDRNTSADTVVDILQKAKDVTILLRRQKNQPLDGKALIALPAKLSDILILSLLRKSLLEFIENYVREFGQNDGEIFISSIVNTFANPSNDLSLGVELLDSIIRLNNSVPQAQRNTVVKKINSLIISNTQSEIEHACIYLNKIESLPEYKELLSVYAIEWVKLFSPDDLTLMQKKFEIYNILISTSVVEADILVEQIISHFPFSLNQELLSSVFDELHQVKKNISLSRGSKLFQAVIEYIGRYGPNTVKALGLIASWIDTADESSRSEFHAQISQSFESSPIEYIRILASAWKGLTSIQIQEHIIHFYSVEITGNEQAFRDSIVAQGLNSIDDLERPIVIQNIWTSLSNTGNQAESFMRFALKFLHIDALLKIREVAIDSVRENRASPESEINLKLLAVTIREDMRRIMPVVDLFVNLFGRGQSDVELALKYVVPCLRPLNITNDHRKKLAEAMGKASNRIEVREIKDQMKKTAEEVGLRWWNPDHWK